MPYRRLPNTDTARLKALHTAFRKGEELSPVDLAFSQKIYYEVRSFIPRYEAALNEYSRHKEIFSEQSRKTQDVFRKARLFFLHFLQVALFAIQRGELPENTMEYFGIKRDDLPSFRTYDELVTVGATILDGEKRRISEGKQAILNPTAAVVRVRYEHFLEAYHSYTIQKRRRDMAHEKVLETRRQADRLIATLWDHIEEAFSDLPAPMKRDRAAQYGVAYVYRKNELRHLDSLHEKV